MAKLTFLAYLRGIYQTILKSTSTHQVHYAIIQSIYDSFIMARDDVDQMRLEMCITTATGRWLDYWGDYFGVYRKANEVDDAYAQRIIDSVKKPKATIPAIKDHLKDYINEVNGTDYTRDDIIIREPWKDIAKYSHKGALSNDARFFSGNYYSHAVIEISIPVELTQDIIDLALAVKAAGVKIIWSVINSYDIVTGFNDADDAWAAYHRWIQTKTRNNQFSGLILSNSSPNPVLSGSREVWYWMTSTYSWYAVVKEHETDRSFTVHKRDLLNLLDYYTEMDEVILEAEREAFRISDDGELDGDTVMSGDELKHAYVERFVKITQEMLDSLELMDSFLQLSHRGKMSTSEGVMLEQVAAHSLYAKLLAELERFKREHPDYYNSVQSYILNGERAMWYVQRHDNWIWNTPTLTMEDFYEYWEPFTDYKEYANNVELDDQDNHIVLHDGEFDVITSNRPDMRTWEPEHTLQNIIDFEDTYYRNYITFGDKYQPPIVTGEPFYWAVPPHRPWLWKSPLFQIDDLPGIFRGQFQYSLPSLDHPYPTLKELKQLERLNREKYSVKGDVQSEIIITSSENIANWLVPAHQPWLWGSPLFEMNDVPGIFRGNPTIKQFSQIERLNPENYTVKGDAQSEIVITTEPID